MKRSGLYSSSDTIAAEATPHGRGGMSVIRISGPDADRIVSELFDRAIPEPGEHKYGGLVRKFAGQEELIDEVVVNRFKSPKSYTGEDVYEISIHGSPIIVAETLDALYKSGARPARPGEFTLRAFLNDRIDLTQAEAVADLVDASSREAADQALKQLRGGIGYAAERIRSRILELLIQCELELDFVEEDVELISVDKKLNIIDEALHEIEHMLSGYHKSRQLREGVKVALIGPPNVGKSSIFNSIICESRAIVHAKPGTTRDILQADCHIGGIKFVLFDTAGLRPTSDDVEDEGVRRAIDAAENAELTINIASVDCDQKPEIASGDASRNLYVMNKVDLDDSDIPEEYLPVSALKGDGIEQLKTRLYETVTGACSPCEATISRERHYRAALNAKESLMQTREGIHHRRPAEMIAEELRDAATAIDELTGRDTLETILDNIFIDFCIGK